MIPHTDRQSPSRASVTGGAGAAARMGATASDMTRLMVNGADSRKQGLTLALMAPEFQRR